MYIIDFIKKHRGKTILITFILAIVITLIWVGQRVTWTGFDKQTLWDWMGLILIPTVLGAGALFFNWSTRKSERERDLNKQNQESLINYLNQMQELMLNHDLFSRAKKGNDARTAARARTVALLRNLDGQSIAIVLQFLTEAELGGNKLLQLDLDRVNFEGTDLRGVDLQEASLIEVNLQDTDLRKAKLCQANLMFANLSRAKLHSANLQLVNLRESNLKEALLTKADLQGAYLDRADLQGAYLEETKLLGAILKFANLRGATVTVKQIETASRLYGATMPDGSQYEDWVARSKPDWNKAEEDSEESSN